MEHAFLCHLMNEIQFLGSTTSFGDQWVHQLCLSVVGCEAASAQ